jgi:hypothetical protein
MKRLTPPKPPQSCGLLARIVGWFRKPRGRRSHSS